MAILAAEGRVALSMRRVASDMGISLSNLQHYFATVDDLIAACADRVLDDATARLDDRFGPDLAAIDRVDLVDYLLAVHRDPQMALVFFEMWAAAARGSGPGRGAMQLFYERYIALVAGHVRDADPGRALAVALLLEGSAVLAAGLTGQAEEEQWQAVRDAVIRLAT